MIRHTTVYVDHELDPVLRTVTSRDTWIVTDDNGQFRATHDATRPRRTGTRVVRPGEHGGHSPEIQAVDWAKVDRRGMRSGLIPGRPGERDNARRRSQDILDDIDRELARPDNPHYPYMPREGAPLPKKPEEPEGWPGPWSGNPEPVQEEPEKRLSPLAHLGRTISWVVLVMWLVILCRELTLVHALFVLACLVLVICGEIAADRARKGKS